MGTAHQSRPVGNAHPTKIYVHLLAFLIISVIGSLGCGSSLHLANQDIVWSDDDSYHVSEAPKERDPDYNWDFVHKSFLYPIDRFIKLPRYFSSNRAQNINALGEVPDSSWYTNRHAHKRMTIDELTTGPNRYGGPDTSGVWTITRSKTQGVTPGFTIQDKNGAVYFIKFDPVENPEMATAAEVISTLFFYAAGYNTPENYIVHFRPEQLAIGDSAVLTDDKGKRRQMNQADLENILSRVSHRPDGTIRALASRRLDGKPIGPFSYVSRRKDDPNDIYSHRHRRELRGLKVIASFPNHVDIKGPNSLDMYVTENGKSYVKHYLIDFGATLGSGSTHAHKPATGHEHQLDAPAIGQAFITLGLLGKPWDDAEVMDAPAVGFFEAKTFRPGKWKESYPNAAFMEMTNQDAYWGAKVVMAFTPDDIRAIVKMGQYSDPAVEKYVADVLIERRRKIGQYWFSKVNPLDHFSLGQQPTLHFKDLGIESGLWQPSAKYHYKLRHHESNKVIDTGVLNGTTELPIPIAAIASASDGKSESSRFIVYELRTERDGEKSKATRVYLYYSPAEPVQLKIVGVEREG